MFYSRPWIKKIIVILENLAVCLLLTVFAIDAPRVAQRPNSWELKWMEKQLEFGEFLQYAYHVILYYLTYRIKCPADDEEYSSEIVKAMALNIPP